MSLSLIEALMDRAWPALDREDTEGWVMRAAGGVTQRANSVWPREQSRDDASAVRAATQWYRSRRLPLIVQVFDDERSRGLNNLLDAQRFTRQSETLIMVRPGGALPSSQDGLPDRLPNDVELSEEPSEEWLRLWWSVDGRGGGPELEIARSILVSCPSLYALVRDDDGVPAAVGRLALVDGRGGIYCMATAAGHRRRGFGRQVLDALLTAGSHRGVSEFWLLVMASNNAAQALYEGAGFTARGRYLYRQARPQRALSGC
ncbi:GNAT family N-acetyltransferase [Arthrobacter sp. KN11-1C]|uniref:GNAT family N-acetyltransferase n=1 Tax=Arthrobacter sp. KN11-1C TaxID=3445774 RepID=UPI003F9EF404